jgi:hypothetical protein
LRLSFVRITVIERKKPGLLQLRAGWVFIEVCFGYCARLALGLTISSTMERFSPAASISTASAWSPEIIFERLSCWLSVGLTSTVAEAS